MNTWTKTWKEAYLDHLSLGSKLHRDGVLVCLVKSLEFSTRVAWWNDGGMDGWMSGWMDG